MPNRPVVFVIHPDRDTWHATFDARGIDRESCERVFVSIPSLSWHRQSLSTDVWRNVHQDLTTAARRIAPGTALHVFAAGAFSLGMLAGRQLNPHAARMTLYQFNQSQARWEDWWPARPSSTPERERVFEEVVDPGDPEVALAISVTHEVSQDEIDAELKRQNRPGVPTLSLTCRARSSQARITADNLDAAVREIVDTLSRLSQGTTRTVHLFYSGPLALLVQVGIKTDLLRCRIIVYERTKVRDRFEFIPTIDLMTGRLLLEDLDATALRETLAENFRDEKTIARVVNDAGMTRKNLALSGAPNNVWQEVIDEARRQRRLVELYRVAEAEYPYEFRPIGRFLWDPARDHALAHEGDAR